MAVGADLPGRHLLEYTSDISLGGLFLKTLKNDAAPGTPVKLTLRVPGLRERIAIHGVVVRSEQGEEGGLAVRFESLPPDVDAALGVLTGEDVVTDESVITDKVILLQDDDLL